MPRISITSLSTILRAPWVTIGSLFVAIVLGLTRSSYLEYLKPVSEFYVAILQMAVLPFLLSTIPITIRAIMLSGGIGGTIKRFILTVIITVVVVCLFSLLISKGLFDLFPIHESTFLKIGTFINSYSDKSDLEISLDTVNTSSADHVFSMISIIPANIFSSLAVNDNTQVIIFCLIFGTALFMSSNKIGGHNIYSALHLIQKICSLISVWTYIFLPIGIISLVAPLLGNTTPELYAMLGMFIFSFILACFVVIIISIITASKMSYNSFSKTSSYLIKPIMMGAACRNTMNCIALGLETMTQDLKADEKTAALLIPMGFATLRFGTIIYFIVSTIFAAALLGVNFDAFDLAKLGLLSIVASFVTLGSTGLATLIPLAGIMRSFGLSYELALPLLVVVDPIANMLRVMVNVAVNCALTASISKHVDGSNDEIVSPLSI